MLLFLARKYKNATFSTKCSVCWSSRSFLREFLAVSKWGENVLNKEAVNYIKLCFSTY